jgi:hypothetical protein
VVLDHPEPPQKVLVVVVVVQDPQVLPVHQLTLVVTEEADFQ